MSYDVIQVYVVSLWLDKMDQVLFCQSRDSGALTLWEEVYCH